MRDRLAGFIVTAAGQAEAWEAPGSSSAAGAASAHDKDRFRQGLGRSTDPKVVALRQAVLEKCVAVRGPSPSQGTLDIPPFSLPSCACVIPSVFLPRSLSSCTRHSAVLPCPDVCAKVLGLLASALCCLPSIDG
jgi:hypothetical protein